MGFSTVSTSVNNTTVLKEKILPITNSSARPAGLVQVFPVQPLLKMQIFVDLNCCSTLSYGWV